MLRKYQNSVVLAIFAFWVLGFAFQTGRSTQHQEDRKQIEATHKPSQAIQAPEVTLIGLRLGEGLLIFATIWLVIVTKALVDGSRESSQKQLRAYVRLSHVRGMSLIISGGSAAIHIQLQAQNWGETPARITSIAVEPLFLKKAIDLPVDPPRVFGSQEGSFLFRKEEFFQQIKIPVNITSAQAVLNGTERLYLIGYIDYIDAFDVRHRGGYAREYDGSPPTANNLSLVSQAGYNFDRLRIPGEGNDWHQI